MNSTLIKYAYLGVTVPFKNNCRNNCFIAISQASGAASSQNTPRKRDLPHILKQTAKVMLSNRKMHVTPEKKMKIILMCL